MPGTPALPRALTRRDLVVYGLLFIGPLAPVGAMVCTGRRRLNSRGT
jgi:hypothetical protein